MKIMIAEQLTGTFVRQRALISRGLGLVWLDLMILMEMSKLFQFRQTKH